MEKSQKSVLMLSMITACLMLVAFVGVGYAAFTVGINVTGTGKVSSSKWEVKFGTPVFSSTSSSTPSTAKEITAPTATATTISGFVVQLQTPGDSISYTFDVTNSGTFDAKLATLTKNAKPTCTGATGAATATTDATNVCKHLNYTLKHQDGTAGQTKKVVLTLTYENFSATADLPVEDVTISGLDITMNYSQVQNS